MSERSIVVELQRLAIFYVVMACAVAFLLVAVRIGTVDTPGQEFIDMNGLYGRTEIVPGT